MGDKGCKASVIMSVYKEPLEWISQAIDSILNQTYSNFEFIIICDNPKYIEGINLLKDYASKDRRIFLIFNGENIGLTKSLNKGLSVAKGEYIVRMDADDISQPQRIEIQIKFMDNNPNIVASGTSAFNMRNGNLKYSKRPASPKYLFSMCIFDSPISHPSSIFRRVVDGRDVKYDESFRYSQDYALWLTLMENHLVSNIDEPLLKYRISEEQISSSNHSAQQEYACKNQLKALKLLKLNLSANEELILQTISRQPEKLLDMKDVRNMVVETTKKINRRDDLETKPMIFKLMLLYSNYLPRHEGPASALYDILFTSIRMRYFSFYCYMSLMKKYLLKIVK